MGMAIDEAIGLLERGSQYNYYDSAEDFCKAYDMAIEIMRKYQKLEQEPTTKNDLGVSSELEKNSKKLEKDFGESDCISRERLKQIVFNITAEYDTETIHIDRLIDEIDNLPSVTPQEQRWIPVSERLPDMDDEVLCWYEYYHWSQKKVLPEYGIGCYLRETSAWFGEVANGKDARVIAWMPLPKAYKPESEDT